MPTRKQRRRQQKLRRHEYEEVYVDDEGNVVEPEEVDEPEPPSRNGRSARPARPAAQRPRATRTVPPPSLGRVLKRGAIFAPIMFIVVSLLAPDGVSVPSQIVQTLFLVAVFLPFSYVMDVVAYRVWLRRSGRPQPGRTRSR